MAFIDSFIRDAIHRGTVRIYAKNFSNTRYDIRLKLDVTEGRVVLHTGGIICSENVPLQIRTVKELISYAMCIADVLRVQWAAQVKVRLFRKGEPHAD
jgi:hypothetical protein